MTRSRRSIAPVRFACLALTASALIIMLPPVAQAQIYLKITGIDGESKDPKHSHWIEATSLQLSSTSAQFREGPPAKVGSAPADTPTPAAVKPGPAGPQSSRAAKADPGSPETSKLPAEHSIASPRDPQSGLPTGKRMHQAILITKLIDKASPLLKRALATNRQFKEVEVELYRNGALSQRYRLRNVVISSVKPSAASIKSGDAKSGENVSLMAAELIQEQ